MGTPKKLSREEIAREISTKKGHIWVVAQGYKTSILKYITKILSHEGVRHFSGKICIQSDDLSFTIKSWKKPESLLGHSLDFIYVIGDCPSSVLNHCLRPRIAEKQGEIIFVDLVEEKRVG